LVHDLRLAGQRVPGPPPFRPPGDREAERERGVGGHEEVGVDGHAAAARPGLTKQYQARRGIAPLLRERQHRLTGPLRQRSTGTAPGGTTPAGVPESLPLLILCEPLPPTLAHRFLTQPAR